MLPCILGTTSNQEVTEIHDECVHKEIYNKKEIYYSKDTLESISKIFLLIYHSCQFPEQL